MENQCAFSQTAAIFNIFVSKYVDAYEILVSHEMRLKHIYQVFNYILLDFAIREVIWKQFICEVL